MEKKHAILLVRVSTSVQDYEAQIYDLRQYGNKFGYTDFHIIETKETAFADFDQKIGTNEMFRFIESNPHYNTIFITELSRLARRQSILHSIKELFINSRIQLYIKDSEYKLLDESGNITQQAETMFTLFGLFAEAEIKQKLERFQRKKKELMELGLSIGGKLLFGYDRFMTDNKKNTLVVNEEQALIIRTVFNWYINGLDEVKSPSVKRISIECIKRGFHPYTHSKRNLNKLLKEEAYTGEKITNNKRKNPKYKLVPNEPEYLISNNKIKYPVIIESETYNSVQEKLKSNITKGDKETKHITILSKLINCPSCGRKLSANYRSTTGASKNSYRCTSRTDTQPCGSSKSLSMNLIDSAVWGLIKADLPTLSKRINEINPDQYLLQLDSHLGNFIEREKEIENEIQENVQVVDSMGKMRNVNVIELVQKSAKKIEKLETELDKIAQEKARIASNKLLIQDKQENVESVIKDNLSTIENSKELLKKYINSFVDQINILEHNVSYTVLEIVLNDFTVSQDYTEYFGDTLPIQLELDYIVIDKRVTRDIKLAYMKSQSPSTDFTRFTKLTFEQIIPQVKKEMNTNDYDLSLPIQYSKLLF
ncbi:recombinase family protein [Flavobacterium hibernum]|uniref:Recombinase family protein n=1 Tax=Flavobacterium hibernum TaxID=37752 RepID=A0A0D0EDP0_9FLAO|nr:recombinase family protein [Flavobacterium hibernum]KIO50939.1 hypothetical protein IW18_20330 [Flavobacterium hibernum]OXA85179.1 recombinase family protein [Flavobacterium hibernum]STO19555.1 Resolvase, N terminal domain [Flavobacterium hibernum]